MAKFFRYPQNYTQQTIGRNFTTDTPPVLIPQIIDNNPNTFSTETTISLDVSELLSNNPTRINSIFLRSSGVTSYSIVSSGGLGTIGARTLPDTIPTYNNENISIVRNGLHNDLYEFNPVTASKLVFTFVGTDIKIYTLMALDLIYEIPTFIAEKTSNSEIVYKKVRRGSNIQENTEGFQTFVGPSEQPRSKWLIDYSTRFFETEEYEKLLDFMDEHPNFAFAGDYSLYPDRVHLAIFPNLETELPFLSRWIFQGNEARFTVGEA